MGEGSKKKSTYNNKPIYLVFHFKKFRQFFMIYELFLKRIQANLAILQNELKLICFLQH